MPSAARVGDATLMMSPPGLPGTIVGPGDPTVLIKGMPAAVMQDMDTGVPNLVPPGQFMLGSTTVMIGGKPAIRAGDASTSSMSAVVGEPTVIIG